MDLDRKKGGLRRETCAGNSESVGVYYSTGVSRSHFQFIFLAVYTQSSQVDAGPLSHFVPPICLSHSVHMCT